MPSLPEERRIISVLEVPAGGSGPSPATVCLTRGKREVILGLPTVVVPPPKLTGSSTDPGKSITIMAGTSACPERTTDTPSILCTVIPRDTLTSITPITATRLTDIRRSVTESRPLDTTEAAPLVPRQKTNTGVVTQSSPILLLTAPLAMKTSEIVGSNGKQPVLMT